MSPSIKAILMPAWLRIWIQTNLIPVLGLQPQFIAFGFLRGIFDMLLLILLSMGFVTGGRLYMNSQFALPRTIQVTAVKWAPVADIIARKADIPREVPLVIWFKENSMQVVNPELCTGIMGTYDLVRSGAHACFTPGPISDLEVVEQLAIGAEEFKKRCPDISYWTQDPEKIKRCYFAYNAGTVAAARLDPEESAYVMNNYDAAHANMVYTDVELGTVQVTSLGAWPTHLAFQSLVVSQMDLAERPIPLSLSQLSTTVYDWTIYGMTKITSVTLGESYQMEFPDEADRVKDDCLAEPHILGRLSLRPNLNPVTDSPLLTQDIHGCSYSLPGMDITSENSTAVLQTPMPGTVTTFTDQWQNSTIRIENDEWIVWLLHPRSYLVKEGDVERGQAVGVMGSVGFSTGPHVHYTIYDKVNETFVDPRLFLP
jgi:hypothetical protein